MSIEYLRVSSKVIKIKYNSFRVDDVRMVHLRTINRTVSLVDHSSSLDLIDGISNVWRVFSVYVENWIEMKYVGKPCQRWRSSEITERKGRATKKFIDPYLLRIALYFEIRVFIKITVISKGRGETVGRRVKRLKPGTVTLRKLGA